MHASQVHQRHHVLALDGVRGLAILSVFCFHSFTLVFHVHSPLTRLFQRTVQTGWVGVDLFFVLSGFLITGILLQNRTAENFYRVFYIRRALRLFPLYYLFLAGTLLIYHAEHYRLRDELWFWLNLSNLPTAFNPMLIPACTGLWSLAIEEQFYLVWPSLVRRLTPKLLMQGCLAVIGGSFLLRNLPPVLALQHRFPEVTYRLTVFRLDTLCAGALLAILVHRYPEILGRRWLLRSVFLAAGAVFLATGFAHTQTDLRVVRVGFTALVFCFSALIALSLSRDSLTARFFSNPFLRRMGLYSYCFYLIHGLPILFLRSHPSIDHTVAHLLHLTPNGNPIVVVMALVEFAVAYALCALSFKVYENPIHQLKRYFPYRHPTTIPTLDLAEQQAA